MVLTGIPESGLPGDESYKQLMRGIQNFNEFTGSGASLFDWGMAKSSFETGQYDDGFAGVVGLTGAWAAGQSCASLAPAGGRGKVAGSLICGGVGGVAYSLFGEEETKQWFQDNFTTDEAQLYHSARAQYSLISTSEWYGLGGVDGGINAPVLGSLVGPEMGQIIYDGATPTNLAVASAGIPGDLELTIMHSSAMRFNDDGRELGHYGTYRTEEGFYRGEALRSPHEPSHVLQMEFDLEREPHLTTIYNSFFADAAVRTADLLIDPLDPTEGAASFAGSYLVAAGVSYLYGEATNTYAGSTFTSPSRLDDAYLAYQAGFFDNGQEWNQGDFAADLNLVRIAQAQEVADAARAAQHELVQEQKAAAARAEQRRASNHDDDRPMGNRTSRSDARERREEARQEALREQGAPRDKYTPTTDKDDKGYSGSGSNASTPDDFMDRRTGSDDRYDANPFMDRRMGAPIILDIDGDGVEVTQLEKSQTLFDFDDDEYDEVTAWAGKDDAFLVIDLDENGELGVGDGDVTQAKEIAFANWTEEDDTDLEGLRAEFDSNEDGVLDENDEHWDKFKIWQDRDQDGKVDEGEMQALEEAEILSVDVSDLGYQDAQAITDDKDFAAALIKELASNHLHGATSLTKTDGSKLNVGDITAINDNLKCAPYGRKDVA